MGGGLRGLRHRELLGDGRIAPFVIVIAAARDVLGGIGRLLSYQIIVQRQSDEAARANVYGALWFRYQANCESKVRLSVVVLNNDRRRIHAQELIFEVREGSHLDKIKTVLPQKSTRQVYIQLWSDEMMMAEYAYQNHSQTETTRRSNRGGRAARLASFVLSELL